MIKSVIAVLLMGVAATAAAQEVKVSLSEESAQFKYGMFVSGDNFGRSNFDMGFLYNRDDSYVTEVGLQVIGEAGSKVPGLMMGIGGKVYGASVPGAEGLALAIGGQARLAIPNYSRAALRADIFYAPTIVSFLEAERFVEAGLGAEYEVLQDSASAFLEYRKFSMKIDGNNKTVDVDEGIRLGIRIWY